MIARKSNKMKYYPDTVEEKLSIISDIIYHSSGIRYLEFWYFDGYSEAKCLVNNFYNSNCSTQGQKRFEEKITGFNQEEYHNYVFNTLDKIINSIPMACGKEVDKLLEDLNQFNGYKFFVKLNSIQFFEEIKGKNHSWEITNAYLKVSPELVKCIRAYWFDKRNLPVTDGLILITQEDLKETLENIPKDIEWVKYVMGT